MKNKNKILSGALCILLAAVGVSACMDGKKGHKETEATTSVTYPDVQMAGAMKNVMWKGELGSSIDLDTISIRKGLYGLGPTSYLTGELLIKDGRSFISTVISDSTMLVEESFEVSAPFLVYTHVNEWKEVDLPADVKTLEDLEKFIDLKSVDQKRPFAFKLKGKVNHATIHVQNLPEGAKVSSPQEAHQGQTSYELKDEAAEIVGFFSTEHQGIFTHHDSYVHTHLITEDETKMGHLDELEIAEMTLFLPEK